MAQRKALAARTCDQAPPEVIKDATVGTEISRMNDVVENGNDENAAQPQTLMALLVRVNREMITIADELRKRPVVSRARRGCDLREYRGAFRSDEKAFYAFETYVEADTIDQCRVCWLVDINWMPSGWELHRTVDRDRASEEGANRTFPVLSSHNLREFAGKVIEAMKEFVESARSYDFS